MHLPVGRLRQSPSHAPLMGIVSSCFMHSIYCLQWRGQSYCIRVCGTSPSQSLSFGIHRVGRDRGTCLSPPPSPLHHFPHYWFPLVVYALEVEVRRRRTRETSKGFLLKTLNWNLGSTPFSGMECYLQA